MGLALLVLIWLITFLSSYFFVVKTWWFPPVASASGAAIDRQFGATLVLMGLIFIAAQVGLGWVVWKYRERGVPASYSHGNTRMELVWTSLTAVLFLGLGAMSAKIWAAERFEPAQSDAVKIEVTGLQFAWYFRYPGNDGKFAVTRPELIDASLGGESAVGIDTTDPAAADDVVSGTMVLPVNRQVDITLRSQDVIHSFFVPEMRFKQDAVPGLMIRMHFTPVKTGTYEIACAELCGLGHYKMHGTLRVVSEQEYNDWLSERLAEKQ